jgi:Zn-dependent protease with chaperone function
VTFFEAQAGHRRAARWWAVGCAALACGAAMMAGAAITLVITIPLFVITHDVARTIPVAGAGTIFVLGVWWRLRRARLRDGGVGLALAIGAREPRQDDLEERQLQNVAEEMAIAAGVIPPRVLLIDDGPPNAAVTGRDARDATVIVTRRLLHRLDREETQAVLGHALATIANGDPRLGIEALAVVETFGLLMAICEAPLNPTMRKASWRTLRTMAGSRPAPPADRDRVITVLADALSPDTIAESGSFLDRPSHLLHPRLLLLIPLFGMTLILKIALLFFTLFVAGPCLWTMLRRRRYLADATAIQLTRRSDTLLSAFETLKREGGIAPAHRWAEHLFVTGAITDPARAMQQIGGAVGQPVILFGVHPPLAGRMKRLQAIQVGMTGG